MEKDAQGILDEVGKEKIKFSKKLKKKDVLKEKEYTKELYLREIKEKPEISLGELSSKLGVLPEEIEKYHNDFLEKSKENDKKVEKKQKFSEKFKEKLGKIKEKLNKLVDKEDKETIWEIFLKLILFGVPLNFTLFVIFKLPFTWYSWFAWGYVLWFTKHEVVNIFRSMWTK